MKDYKDDDYFAGLADGEGCFHIARQSLSAIRFGFHLSQRVSPISTMLLQELQVTFGGRIYTHHDHKAETLHWQWSVHSQEDVVGLITYFDKHPLRLKALEYQVWREAVLLYYTNSVGRGGGRTPKWLTDQITIYNATLQQLKKYIKPTSGE